MIPIRPIVRHSIDLGTAEIAAVLAGMASDRVSEGREQRAFEDDFARYHQRKYAVSFSSGRSALYAFIVSLGLPRGSEIIVPAYTFFTIPDVVRACGYTPVFAPCKPLTYALDPERLDGFVTGRTGAVIVIHPFGQPAPMDEIADFAGRRGIVLIEDPSQSIGARYRGKTVGAFGSGACFSLVHGKNMTTFGGGMAVTDDERYYREILLIQANAAPPAPAAVRREIAGGLFQWLCTTRAGYRLGPFLPFYLLNLLNREKLDSMFLEPRVGFSPGSLHALSNLQSALGRRQLARLDTLNSIRKRNAEMLIAGLGGIRGLMLPQTVAGGEGTWNSFPVRVPRATEFQRELMKWGVDTRKDYMDILDFKDEWDRPGEVVYLPNHPGVSVSEMDHVISRVKAVVEGSVDGN